jgi:hypothetical protein
MVGAPGRLHGGITMCFYLGAETMTASLAVDFPRPPTSGPA